MSTASRWGSAGRHLVQHHMGPFPALDPVDGGQHHTVGGARVAQRPLEPVFETRGRGVQGGQGHQGVEVVGLGRAVQAPRDPSSSSIARSRPMSSRTARRTVAVAPPSARR